jgi:hypothetical protein
MDPGREPGVPATPADGDPEYHCLTRSVMYVTGVLQEVADASRTLAAEVESP